MATSSNKNPFLSGFALGLLTGLVLAVGVALLVTRNNPFVGNTPSDTATPAHSQSAPADAPRYEFGETAATGLVTEPTSPAMPASSGYFLQAGAFTRAADAEQMKARLALLGFEARVLLVPGKEAPLSKVQIGPYKALDELNNARARLTQNDIDTILVKIPPQTNTNQTPQPQENP